MKKRTFAGLVGLALTASIGFAAGVSGQAYPFPPGSGAPPAPGGGPNAAPPASANRGCAWVRQIYDWRRVDDQSIMVRTSPSKRFLVTFMGPCRETRHRHGMSISRNHGTCLSRGDRITFRGFGGYEPVGFACVVASVQRVGAEQAAR
jgi:hypothetical protein